VSQIAVLIPTRNRPEKIAKLLDSLRSSTIKPNQIIIVASGEDIKNQLKPFEDSFEITYQYTQKVGQIAQKKIGISLINEGNNWCLFLDDDLTVDRRAIEFALEAVNSRFAASVVGVGLSLPATSRAQNASPVTLRMGSLFGIHIKSPGKVLRNGHATSYLHLEEITATEWLNGASMWRKSVLNTYGLGIPSTRYAACEDLIFSYPLHEKGELIYAPKSKLHFQDVELSDFDSLFVFESASYWRYYFVCQNGLSRISFFYGQFGRILYIVLRTRNGKLSTFSKFIQSQIPLLKSYFGGKPHQLLLEELVGK
jgi:glycosyltransferase involved in cell wall biosynthesis